VVQVLEVHSELAVAAAQTVPAQMEAGLKSVLDAESVDKVIVDNLVTGKYLSLKTFVFSFRTEAALDKWFLKKIVEKELLAGIEADDYEFSPQLSALRSAWDQAKLLVGTSANSEALAIQVDGAGPGGGTVLKLTDSAKTKTLGAGELCRLVKACEIKYKDEVFVDENTPSRKLVQDVMEMLKPDKGLSCIPLAKVDTLADDKEFQKTGRRQQLGSEFTGGFDKLRTALVVRSRAFMLSCVGSLAAWNHYIETFMATLKKRPSEKSGLRAPTVAEAADADFEAMNTVCDLVNKEGWDFDTALRDIASPGRELRTALAPRQVTASTSQALVDNASKRRRGNQGPQLNMHVQHGALAKNPAWVSVFPDEKKPPCFSWCSGKCSRAKCKFVHKCPVKKPDGQPCGDTRHKPAECLWAMPQADY
jgi:hypothetical protein